MAATFSVREVAKLIQRGEALEPVVVRLRNWTTAGLIRTTGEKNPGTGRKRHYTEAAVLDAMVLSALTEVLRIPAVEVAKMRDVERKTVFQVARLAYEQYFEKAERDGAWCYLAFHRRWPHEPVPAGGAPSTVILSVLKGRDIEIPPWSAASAVVNLTPLFRLLRDAASKETDRG